ncbi:ribosomal-processing cysteine protease Prp [Fructilactobacillus carniphilus]|uniref:Ribosomal processing cysteine protease Prp n=1 Tax=Fructilactobacillus carniphilus TaxID=2940297 RepID=A0ABY5BZY4_9LACO|nr:ribosomal-processing cysteine protease Prp [Fructilactobacillus carniphilus]USS91153.1 ribosomal-processing cysteine protease Prp [Fructilactobacillus carniphilus]
MIRAHFATNHDVITGFELSGHADSGEYGHDIVCAAVSALAITTVNGLEQIAGLQPAITQNETDGGYLSVSLTKTQQNNAAGQTLLQSFENGISAITDQYSDFVTIE